jgi:hypothetical protein
MVIISLVKENIFAVGTINCKVLNSAIRGDPVFLTKPLPELRTNCVEDNNKKLGAHRVT